MIPNLLQQDTNIHELRTFGPKNFTIPVVLHYDAFSSETGCQLWGLNPKDYPLYGQKGSSTPQMVSGFGGKEGRLLLFARYFFTLILTAFRVLYHLPIIPHIGFVFRLAYVVCMLKGNLDDIAFVAFRR